MCLKLKRLQRLGELHHQQLRANATFFRGAGLPERPGEGAGSSLNKLKQNKKQQNRLWAASAASTRNLRIL
jgi:hypothetical protein